MKYIFNLVLLALLHFFVALGVAFGSTHMFSLGNAHGFAIFCVWFAGGFWWVFRVVQQGVMRRS